MVFAGQDAWRSHPVISNGVKHMFPGLRQAAIIFGAYLVVDTAWSLAHLQVRHHLTTLLLAPDFRGQKVSVRSRSLGEAAATTTTSE